MSLRSESGTFLAVPTTRGVTSVNRCFRKDAVTLWNNVPVNIRKCKTLDTFKKKIKTNQLFLDEYIMYLAGKNYVFLCKSVTSIKLFIVKLLRVTFLQIINSAI